MNRFAYRTSGFAIEMLSGLSHASIRLHGEDQIPPDAAIIFVVNHFTRIETLLLPAHLYRLTGERPVWSLADYRLFRGALKTYFDSVGVVSTRDPDRDLLIVRTLLAGKASWIIFPEGRMVKNKKIVDGGRFMIQAGEGKHPPHTGAAALALRTEFFRQRILALAERQPEEAARLMELFELKDSNALARRPACVVPVNLTYYPLRARENILSKLALQFMGDLGERAAEEIMTEGTMLLSGVDVDIRFGAPIPAADYMTDRKIRRDVSAVRKIGLADRLPSERAFRRAARRLRDRFMGVIYQMTTVNPDHLFAGLMRLRPFRRIDPEDLRRRVFLAAGMDMEALGVHRHQSLDAGQVHLLTDDRYGRVRDFLTVAREKGILRGELDRLRVDRGRLGGPLDFHKARVDNPVAVIANEIEPLRPLLNALRRIAWLPAFWVRRRAVRQLLEADQVQFEADYAAHFLDGESKSRDVGAPFLIRGETRDVGVLLIHGYMAAPFEVAGLAVYLGRRGHRLYVPRLRGHGTAPEDLAGRKRSDWIASVDHGYAILKNQCRRVVVGGFSTGGALALDLAARVPEVAGVFAICPPRRLQDPSLKGNLARGLWNRLAEMVRGDAAAKDGFIENRTETPHVSYLRNPVSGIREVELLVEELEPRLPEIRTPALVVHSRRDPVADPRLSRRLFELLGAEDKRYALFNFDRHFIIAGPGSEQVFRTVGDFVEAVVEGRLERTPPPKPAASGAEEEA
jgi:esterase/lipase/1-acyl-sn-glycerol-3-phosphate acyltransferase